MLRQRLMIDHCDHIIGLARISGGVGASQIYLVIGLCHKDKIYEIHKHCLNTIHILLCLYADISPLCCLYQSDDFLFMTIEYASKKYTTVLQRLITYFL